MVTGRVSMEVMEGPKVEEREVEDSGRVDDEEGVFVCVCVCA